MPQMSKYLGCLERWNDIDVGILQRTKIRKVLKLLLKLDFIPQDEEFRFRARANALLDKWKKLGGYTPASIGGSA